MALLINNQWKIKIQSYSYTNEGRVTTRLKIEKGPAQRKKDQNKKFFSLQKQIIKTNTSIFQKQTVNNNRQECRYCAAFKDLKIIITTIATIG